MTISQPKEIADIKREAVLLCQNGRFQQAQELLEKLGQQQRFDAEACSLLATIYGQLGDFNKAIDAYRDGIKLQSNAPQMHFGLGKALARQGLFSEAEDSYKRALDLQPSFTQSIPDLAVALFQQNKLTESEHYFQEALRSDPKSVKAMLGLGRIYQIWRKAELATNYYKNALTINPNIALAEHQLGHMAMLAAQHEEADKHLEAALKIDPNYAPAYLELGDLRIICNRIDEAKAAYQAAISISPDYTSAIVGIAKVYELSGDTQAAYDQIEPLIERGIKDIGLGVVFANICRHFGLCQDAIDYLEEILADLQEGGGFIDQIHFSLGKLYDAQGEYDKAFMHFAEGNRPKSDTFNPVEHTAYIDSVIQTCDWSFFIKAPRTSRKSQRPVFIIGMP
ncbi:MAG: tetratricopeptide repeat protein, partial [Gammaproteobacteria bacterium]